MVTAEEFWQFDFEEGKRYELIEGEIVEMAPSKPLNSITAARILAAVLNYVDEHDLGYVQGADGGYTLAPNTVRIPDVSFIAKARVPEIPSEFIGGPDLAIEVISASESSQDVINSRYAVASVFALTPCPSPSGRGEANTPRISKSFSMREKDLG